MTTPGPPPPPPPREPTGPAPRQPSNTLGLLALIFGMISIPIAICCELFTLPFAIAGIVNGYLGRLKAAQGEATNPEQATWGLITGLVGLVVGILSYLASVVFDLGQLVELP